jgi:hypothetical protein
MNQMTSWVNSVLPLIIQPNWEMQEQSLKM